MAINVGSAIAYLDLDMSKFKSGIAEAKSALQDFTSSADSLSTKVQNFGSSVSHIGGTLTKSLTLPIVGIGTAVTKTASDFDSSMSKVEAVSGATAEEMEMLRKKAMEMGAKTKFSAKESADAFTYMAMAGWNASQMVDGIAGIMSLAAADGLDLATTSDIVTDALTAFGLQASDSAHFADVLAQTSSSANTNVSMLGESFKYVAPVAGALGMSVEDVSLALGLMANAGIKGTQSGTVLRASLTNLIKPTDQMQSKMEELGIQVLNSDGSMKSLKEILDILRQKFSTLSEAEKANAAATLFGKEAMSGMLAIINTSADDYNRLSESIGTATGRADEMADTMMDNLNGSITLLKSALESLMIKLGEALVPLIQQITELITKIVEKLNTMSDEEIQQVVRIAGIVAALGPFLLIVGKVISIIGSVIKIGSALFTGIKTLVGFVNGGLIPAIAAINPTVLIIIGVIGALIAIGVALYKNWDTISEVASSVWDSITDAVSNAVDKMSELFTGLSEWIEETCESIGGWISDLWSSISGFFSDLFSNLGTWIGDALSAVKNFFFNLGASIGSSIGSIFDSIVSWGSSLVQKAGEIGSGFVDSFLGFFDGLVTKTGDLISGMVEMFSEWGSNILSKAGEIGGGFVSAITSGLEKVGSFFADIFTDILDSISTMGPKIFETGKNIIMALWEGMRTIFGGLTKWITDGLSKLLSPVMNMLDKILNPIKNVFSGVTGFVSGLFKGSHANGLDYVPYNGYVAQLHEGERVLTKQENEKYSSDKGSSGDTYNFYSPKAIDEYQAARLLKQTKLQLDMDM